MIIAYPYAVDSPADKRPWLTWALVSAMAIVFIFQQWLLPFSPGALAIRLGFGQETSELWRIFTYPFLQVESYPLFIFNIILLYLLGYAFECRYGSLKLMLLWVCGAIAGAITFTILGGMHPIEAPLIGSTSVIGLLMGGFLALMPKARIHVHYAYYFGPKKAGSGTEYFPMSILIIAYVATIAIASRGPLKDIYIWPLLAGAVLGFLICGILTRFRHLSALNTEQRDTEAHLRRALKKEMFKENLKAAQERLGAKEKQILPPSADVLQRFLGLQDARQAEVEYKRLVSENPLFSLPPQAQLKLAQLFIETARNEIAIAALENLLNRFPTSLQANTALLSVAKYYSAIQEMRPKSLEYLRKLLQGNPSQEQRGIAQDLLDKMVEEMAHYSATDFDPAHVSPDMPASFDWTGIKIAGSGMQLESNDSAIDLGLQDFSEESKKASSQKKSLEKSSFGNRFSQLSPASPEATPPPIPMEEFLHKGDNQEPDPAMLEITAILPKNPNPITSANPENLTKLDLRNPSPVDPDAPLPPISDSARNAATHIPAEDAIHITAFESTPEDKARVTTSRPNPSCSLLLSPHKKIDIERLLNELANLTRSDPNDIADDLRFNGGILFEDISYPKGQLFRDSLQRAHVAVELYENLPEWDFSNVIDVRCLHLMGGVLHMETASGDLKVPPAQINLIGCGGVRLVPGSDKISYLLDLFVLHSHLHLRIWDDTFAFNRVRGLEGFPLPKLGRDNLGPVKFLTQRLVEMMPEARKTFTMREWLKNLYAITPRRFRTITTYDAYNRWHLLSFFGKPAE